MEGIQLLTAQTSFRNPTGVQLVRDGADFARLHATAADENRLLELGLTIEAGKRRFTLNGKQKRTADLKGVIPSVTFTPDDLNLAKVRVPPAAMRSTPWGRSSRATIT